MLTKRRLKTHRVTLNHREMKIVAAGGSARQINALVNGLPEKKGHLKNSKWRIHIEGAGAEYAVAKFFGLQWHAVADGYEFRNIPGDVGRLEVRSTPLNQGRLIIHDEDPDDRPFILVRGQIPVFHLIGWYWGHAAKRWEFYQKGDGRPAFFVPNERLRDLRQLQIWK